MTMARRPAMRAPELVSQARRQAAARREHRKNEGIARSSALGAKSEQAQGLPQRAPGCPATPVVAEIALPAPRITIAFAESPP